MNLGAAAGGAGPFGTPYRCGETSVIFGVLGSVRAWSWGRVFDLKPVVAASGRVPAVDETTPASGARGARARHVRGKELPDCRAIGNPISPSPPRPGARLDDHDRYGHIFLNADFGALQLRFPRTAPQVSADASATAPSRRPPPVGMDRAPDLRRQRHRHAPPYGCATSSTPRAPRLRREPKSLLTGGE